MRFELMVLIAHVNAIIALSFDEASVSNMPTYLTSKVSGIFIGAIAAGRLPRQ